MIKIIISFIFLLILVGCKNIDNSLFSNKNNVPIKNILIKKDKFPKSGYVIPKKNETIYDLSNRYDILPQKIIKYNYLKKPYNISTKKRIYLPYPLIHHVKKDENIYELSMIYAVSQSDIVELNDLKKPYKLKPFTNLKIPLYKDYSLIGLEDKVKLENFKSKDVNALSKKNVDLLKFYWPAKGKIVKSFGSFDNGKQHNDGINIKVLEDKPILASMDGKVAFVGSNLKSFGNMILIKHNKVWVTAYARITEFKVSEGDFVKKGDIIGNVLKDETLHFQIRKSRNPVNPLLYLN